jgi:hypothetical protein
MLALRTIKLFSINKQALVYFTLILDWVWLLIYNPYLQLLNIYFGILKKLKNENFTVFLSFLKRERFPLCVPDRSPFLTVCMNVPERFMTVSERFSIVL